MERIETRLSEKDIKRCVKCLEIADARDYIEHWFTVEGKYINVYVEDGVEKDEAEEIYLDAFNFIRGFEYGVGRRK